MTSVAEPRRRILLTLAETLAIGAAGGTLFQWLGMPAGFISGSMLAVTAATLAGRPCAMPDPLARVVSLVLGIGIGGNVSPDLARTIAVYPLSLAMLLLATIGMTAAMALYLNRVHRWEPLSALLGAVPGAMSQLFPYAAELKADLQTIAISQSFRVIALTASIPLIFGLSGSPDAPPRLMTLATPAEMAVLFGCALAACYTLFLLGFPGSWMVGSLATSATLHATGLVHGTLPNWLTIAAMMMLGSYVGTRFRNVTLAALARHIGAASVSFAIGLGVAVTFAALTAWITGMRLAAVVVAFAPGGIDLMPILALALNLDPLYVSAHHLLRVIFISLALPAAVAMLNRRVASRRTPPPPHTR